MYGRIAPKAKHGLWRMLCILATAWLASAAHADTALSGAMRDVHAGDTPQLVLEAFRRGDLASFDPHVLRRFPTQGQGTWVVL